MQLPVLAKRLKDTFAATILTSYGMTECMPISTPPFSYDLQPSGTSGVAVGPRICIVTDDLEAAAESGAELCALPPGRVGSILVRGSPCFSGYEAPQGGDNESNEECFFTVDKESGWFCTGKSEQEESGFNYSFSVCVCVCVMLIGFSSYQ